MLGLATRPAVDRSSNAVRPAAPRSERVRTAPPAGRTAPAGKSAMPAYLAGPTPPAGPAADQAQTPDAQATDRVAQSDADQAAPAAVDAAGATAGAGAAPGGSAGGAPGGAVGGAGNQQGAAPAATAGPNGAAAASGRTATAGAAVAGAAAGGGLRTAARAAGHADQEPPAPRLAMLSVARFGNIRPPLVPAPPRDAVRRSGEILARTGSTPELLHAQVEQAVMRLADTARTAQRDIIFRIEMLGRDTGHSIDQIAREVPRIVAGAVGIVRAAAATTLREITESADAQIKAIGDHHAQIDDDYAATRTQVMTDVHQNLIHGSDALRAADTALQAAFSETLPQARTSIETIPDAGVVMPILLRDQIGGAPAAEARPANLEQASEDIIKALRDTANKPSVQVWQDVRCAEATPFFIGQQKTGLKAAATARGAQLDSPETRAEFARISFGLIAPTLPALENDAEGDKPRVDSTVKQQQRRVRTVAEGAQEQIRQKLEGMKRALDPAHPKSVPHQVEENLHKAGRRIVKALHEQARAAEHAMRGTAPAMADAYPEMVARVKPLLPPGVLLDARVRQRITDARLSVERVHAAQLAAARERADAAVRAARDSLRQQAHSLAEMAGTGARSIRETLIPSRFDFELVAALYTNPMHAGAQLATGQVRHFAETQAANLTRPLTAADHGVTAVTRAAVGFLNSNIQGEYQGFLSRVRGLADEFRDGPFTGVRKGVLDDLAARVDKLDGALHAHRSVGWGIAATLTGGLALGGYLYATRSKADDALSAIGGLPWPGPPALEQMFAVTGGSLRDRISGSSLSDSDQQRLLNLLSDNPATRLGERQRVVADAAGWLTGPSTETRDAVLRGMGADERATMSSQDLATWQQSLRSSLHGTDLEIVIGYTEGNPAHVLAARMQARLDKAYADDDDATVLAMDQIAIMARQELGGGSGASVDADVAALTDRMYGEFERLTPAPGDAAAPARDPSRPMTAAEMTHAREHFVRYATRARYEIPQSPEGVETTTTVVVPVDHRVQNIVSAMVMKGGDSKEAWAARASYEITRAEAESRDRVFGSGLSESTQVRLSEHTENPVLARAVREQDRIADQVRESAERGDPPERQQLLRAHLAQARHDREEAEKGHDERLGLLARTLDPRADVTTPGAARQMVAQRVGAVFATTNEEDRRYGREIIEQGRGSLAAGVRLSVRGVGTNEELLSHVTADRAHLEIRQADQDYLRYGDHSETMRDAIADDVSGDLAFDMDLALRGEPENGKDRAEIAALRYQQQRVKGTGFIAAVTMEGSWQQRELDSRRDAMGGSALDAALAEARERGDDRAVARLSMLAPNQVFGPDGRINNEVALLAFDEDGNLRGDHRAEFELSIDQVGRAANSYRAEIDRQEALMTSIITALAIVVSVLLLVVPGVNVAAAGMLVALTAGIATMVVKEGMRGGRYGWEEAAGDAAMTAVDVATAGMGAGLGGDLGKMGMAGRLLRAGTALE